MDIQVSDWVEILNPQAGQPKEGLAIQKTKDNLIKIKGRITLGYHIFTQIQGDTLLEPWSTYKKKDQQKKTA